MAGNDWRGRANGSLAWTPTNYYGTDATKLLGGLQGPLEQKPLRRHHRGQERPGAGLQPGAVQDADPGHLAGALGAARHLAPEPGQRGLRRPAVQPLARRPDLRRAAHRQQRQPARLEQHLAETRQHQRHAAGRPSEQPGRQTAADQRHPVRPGPAPEVRQGRLLPRADRPEGHAGRLGIRRLGGPFGQQAGGDGAELRQPLRVRESAGRRQLQLRRPSEQQRGGAPAPAPVDTAAGRVQTDHARRQRREGPVRAAGRPARLRRRQPVAPRGDELGHLDGRAVGHRAAAGDQHHQGHARRGGRVRRVQRARRQGPQRQRGRPRRPLQRLRQRLLAQGQRALPGGPVAAAARHRVARLPARRRCRRSPTAPRSATAR